LSAYTFSIRSSDKVLQKGKKKIKGRNRKEERKKKKKTRKNRFEFTDGGFLK